MNVNKLKPGDVIGPEHNIKFLVASVYQGLTKHQKSYVACTLQNKDQKLDWFVWDMTKEDFDVKEGTVLYIQIGVVSERNGSLQIGDIHYQVTNDNPLNYLQSISEDRKQVLVRRLENLCRDNIPQSHPLFTLMNYILFQSKIGENFRMTPASVRVHSPMLGGLLEHSVAVTESALRLAEDKNIDRSLLTAGAILHDIGKVAMYTYTPTIQVTTAGALLEHIVLGVMMLTKIIIQQRKDDPVWSATFSKETELKLLHLIVSHQNTPEYGSPVRPAIPEAFLLATADAAVSKIETYEEEILKVDKGKSSWSQLMKQFIYRPVENIISYAGVIW